MLFILQTGQLIQESFVTRMLQSLFPSDEILTVLIIDSRMYTHMHTNTHPHTYKIKLYTYIFIFTCTYKYISNTYLHKSISTIAPTRIYINTCTQSKKKNVYIRVCIY